MDLLRHYCLFLCIISCVVSEYVIRVDQFNFVVVDRDIIISQSSLINQEGNRSYLSGHLVFSRSINDVKLLTSLEIARPKLQRLRLFDKKLDLCSFFTNEYRNKFVRQIYNNYIPYLNVPPSCPLKPHFNYTLHRGFVDDRHLPDFLPECSFFLKSEFQHKSKRVAHMLFSGQLSPVASKTIVPKIFSKL